MLDNNVEKLVKQIDTIRNQIQEKGYIDKDTYKTLEKEVDELRIMIMSLDKDLALNSEKQQTIYIQLERLDEKIKELANNTQFKDDKKRDTTEKVLLLILGAIISFIFNKFQ